MEHYRALLKLRPDHPNALANLSFLLERDNQLEEARRQAERSLALDQSLALAQLTLASVERRSGEAMQARDRLQTLLKNERSFINRSLANNQLAQCHEALGEYELAFSAWSESNRLMAEHHPAAKPIHSGSYGLGTLDEIQQWLSTARPQSWNEPAPATTPRLVFLVGFPRSGTTLLDRMLSAHPDIEVLEEQELLADIRESLLEEQALETFDSLGQAHIEAAREEYLRGVREARQQPSRQVIVDKLPLNLVYLFLIHRLFPNARILFALRDPRDVVLSCYFQSFDLQGAMPYFLDLESTAAYYATAMQLAVDSLEKLKIERYELYYEKLVADHETELKGVLGFLELPWSSDLLNYRQKAADRAIDTPSYQQVVQPLYTSSIGRWKHYPEAIESV